VAVSPGNLARLRAALDEIEADVARAPSRISATRCRFWLRECRSYELLRDLARRFPEVALCVRRPALRAALTGDEERTAALLKRGGGTRAAAGPAVVGAATLRARALAPKPTMVDADGVECRPGR
jgi:hypothetical protein